MADVSRLFEEVKAAEHCRARTSDVMTSIGQNGPEDMPVFTRHVLAAGVQLVDQNLAATSLLCSEGFFLQAEMVLRSTLDVVARLIFVLRGGDVWTELVCECGPVPQGLTDIDLRALLHHMIEDVKTEKRYTKPGQSAPDVFNTSALTQSAAEVRSIIGEKWFGQLQKGMGFLNRNLEDLLASTGLEPMLKHVYGFASQVIHGAGATRLLTIDLDCHAATVVQPDPDEGDDP